MTTPFYVSPEQQLKDKADYAVKGIARGRGAVVLSFADGILLAAENPSGTLRKTSEIHDRIAFAGVGKYHEFEGLRQLGIRYADTNSFLYDRADVSGRALAAMYAQIIGAAFVEQTKPLEVEMAVAELGAEPERDRLYRLSFDGSVQEEPGGLALGGQADRARAVLAEGGPGLDLGAAALLAVAALTEGRSGDPLPPELLEIAVLDRAAGQRAYRRLTPEQAGL
jgi:proteasome alpha subunit